VKIAGNRAQFTQGVGDVLFDAQVLYEFIKTGNTPKPDTVTKD
jgi:hypothetical protein